MKANQRPAVCIVRHAYYPDGHVRRDAETLAQAGYDVSVVALRRSDQPARESLNGVAVHRLPVEHRRGSLLRYVWEYALFFVLAFVRVATLHAGKRFRVVEVDNMPDILAFTALIPKLTGARVILYIFDNMPELLMLTRRVRAGHPLVRLLSCLERVSAGFADRVVVTQATAREIVRSRGVPLEKLAVVLNCPDETVFRPRPPRARERASDAFEIVTHGAVLERYGIQVLIDALPKVAAAVPNVRAHVFGEGEYRCELEARARQNGVADLVDFHGLAPLAELIETLARADVGYVGMLCNNMLSNKLMEYVALGVPAVVARWPTYEHYFPEDTVMYYDPGSADDAAAAVLAVYRDPDGARVKAGRAARLYSGYRWAAQREVYLGIYADLGAAVGARHSSYPSRSAP